MDWGDMHEELVELIMSKLSVEDRHNFSLVCPLWDKVFSPYRYSPCLLLPDSDRGSHTWQLFQHKSFFTTEFPELDKSALVRCSRHGWLLMSPDDETLFFFNPSSNQKIQVPDIPPGYYATISFFHPPTSPYCFIAGIQSVMGCPVKIYVLRHGEDTWKIGSIYLPGGIEFKESLASPILHDGKLYFLDVRGNVARVDLIATVDMKEDDGMSREHGYVYSKCLKQRRRRKNIKEHFLVKPEGDDAIFAVFVRHAERKVQVFRLMEDISWEPIDDLGNRVFYVSSASSFGYATYDKGMKNKIFFPKFHCDKIVFYSLDTHEYHAFGGDYSSKNSYGVRSFDIATWTMLRPTIQFPTQLLTWGRQEDESKS